MPFKIPFVCFATAAITILCSGQPTVSIRQEDNNLTPVTHQFEWEAESGVRYEPQYSTDLSNWTTVEGYPKEIVGDAEPIPFSLDLGRMFFQVIQWAGLDNIAPQNIANFAATGGDRSVSLIWTDATDADVAWYEVTWTPAGSAAKIVPAGTMSYTATGLNSETSYAFTVKTVDTSGNRSDGETDSATTTAPPAFPELEIEVGPTRVSMSQFEVLTITAYITPVPDRPVKFRWSTPGTYGTIDGETGPYSEFIEVTSDGSSQVYYTAITPGGIDTIVVEVFDAASTDLVDSLVDGSARIEVAAPAQTARFAMAAVTTPSSVEGRLNNEFGSGWIFEKIPGVITYIATLEKKPGEGWSYGPIGVEFVHRIGSDLRDKQWFLDEFGEDILGVGDNGVAIFARGHTAENYKPDDEDALATIELQRQAVARQEQAEWTIRPNTVYDRHDK